MKLGLGLEQPLGYYSCFAFKNVFSNSKSTHFAYGHVNGCSLYSARSVHLKYSVEASVLHWDFVQIGGICMLSRAFRRQKTLL